jgi:hypothetical protein
MKYLVVRSVFLYVGYLLLDNRIRHLPVSGTMADQDVVSKSCHWTVEDIGLWIDIRIFRIPEYHVAILETTSLNFYGSLHFE